MKTFVLVHGGGHGGWCWKKVTPLLRAAGYEVYTPTLTGLGERAHLLSAEVGLHAQAQDILNVLYYEDLNNVILVGHSYAGMVITAVAQQAPERLAHVVYLDALVPQDGQSMKDIMGTEAMALFRQEMEDGWRLPVTARTVERLGITSEADLAWVVPRLTPQSRKTFEEPVGLINEAAAALPRTFIWADNPHTSPIGAFAKMAKASKEWGYYELKAAHDIMITEPRKLADILIEIAKNTEQSNLKQRTS